jgi:hypothetical protein
MGRSAGFAPFKIFEVKSTKTNSLCRDSVYTASKGKVPGAALSDGEGRTTFEPTNVRDGRLSGIPGRGCKRLPSVSFLLSKTSSRWYLHHIPYPDAIKEEHVPEGAH